MGDKKILADHQPDLFPYEQFWRKMERADMFLLLPTYKTCSNKKTTGFHSRQSILGWDGEEFLKIPADMEVANFHNTPIKEEVRQDNLNWREYQLMRLRLAYGFNYEWEPSTGDKEQIAAFKREKALKTGIGKEERARRPDAEFFERFYPEVAEIYRRGQKNLADFNVAFVLYLKERLGVGTPLKICTYGEPNIDNEIFIDHNVEVAEKAQEAVLQKGPAYCRAELGQVIEAARLHSSREGFTQSVDEAVDSMIREIEAVREGAFTSYGTQKIFKIGATLKLIRMLQMTGNEIMLSGQGTEGYALNSIFEAADLENTYHHGKMASYRQVASPEKFVPYMCALDILFNLGGLPIGL
jgi:hypothetical protein